MAQNDLTGFGEINALLGAGTAYEGKLVFDGRVRIDGEFTGEIFGDDILVLGQTAKVRARIEVGTLIVHGAHVEGEIHARQLVELHAPGAIYADIVTPQIFIDKGVTFQGACTMDGGPSEVHELDDEVALVDRIGESLSDAPGLDASELEPPAEDQEDPFPSAPAEDGLGDDEEDREPRRDATPTGQAADLD